MALEFPTLLTLPVDSADCIDSASGWYLKLRHTATDTGHSVMLSTLTAMVQAGKYDKAVAIMGHNQWWHKLNAVVSQLNASNPAQAAALHSCAAFFRRGSQVQFAREAYTKLQDYSVRLPQHDCVIHLSLYLCCKYFCIAEARHGLTHAPSADVPQPPCSQSQIPPLLKVIMSCGR